MVTDSVDSFVRQDLAPGPAQVMAYDDVVDAPVQLQVKKELDPS
ncbi:MAG: hypothetical protein ACLUJG_08625 [Lawsonibacter sp.]